MKGFYPGDIRAVAAGQRGGAKRAVQLKQERVKYWSRQYPGIDPEVLEQVRYQGYQAGWATGVRDARKREDRKTA